MSTSYGRIRHAKLKQRRRLRKKQLLAGLKSRASLKNASKNDIAAYTEAVKQREKYLMKERKRKELWRKKLKEMVSNNDKCALAKAKKIKQQKQKQYIKHKAIGKCKGWDCQKRRTKLWTSIEKKITNENKNINESWVM